MDYCGECQKAIDNALSKIPERYSYKMELIPKEDFDYINKTIDTQYLEYKKEISNNLLGGFGVTSITMGDEYVDIEGCYINHIYYTRGIKKNGEIEIKQSMEYDLIDKKLKEEEFFKSSDLYTKIDDEKITCSREDIQRRIEFLKATNKGSNIKLTDFSKEHNSMFSLNNDLLDAINKLNNTGVNMNNNFIYEFKKECKKSCNLKLQLLMLIIIKFYLLEPFLRVTSWYPPSTILVADTSVSPVPGIIVDSTTGASEKNTSLRSTASAPVLSNNTIGSPLTGSV